MKSIPQCVIPATPYGTQEISCNPHAQDQEMFEPAPELVRRFLGEAKRQIVTGDYLRRKWLPVYGPRFYTLIKALRGHCSYDITEGEARCYPSETTLAQECCISRRTLLYWLQRSPEGRFARKVTFSDGTVRWEDWDWSALNHFLRIEPRWRFDKASQRSFKAVNWYFIRMDDPPVPEDEPLIWERARELAAQYLTQEQKRQAKEREREARCQQRERQAEERERDTHQGQERHAHREQESGEQGRDTRRQEQERQAEEQEAVATHATSFDPANCTHHNVQTLHASQCANSAHNHHPLTSPLNTDTYRSMGERQPDGNNADMAMGRDKKTQVGGEPDGISQEQQTDREGHKGTGPAPRTGKRTERIQPTDFDRTLLQAERVAGSVLYDLMCAAQARAPIVGMRTVLIALVNAGAPPEKLLDLVELGRNRVRRFRARGGRIHTTLAGFFISVMQHLATDAKNMGWDTALIELEDDIEFQRARWRSRTRGAITPEEPEPAPGEEDQETLAEASATPEATTAPETSGDEEPTRAEAAADTDPPACPAEAAPEASEEAGDRLWVDSLLPTIPGVSGHQGDARLLWGFVRDALRARTDIGFARKQHLEALTPAIDPANPHELVLLSTSENTARFIESALLREIVALRDKLLYHIFDEVRIQHVPCLPAWARQEEDR